MRSRWIKAKAGTQIKDDDGNVILTLVEDYDGPVSGFTKSRYFRGPDGNKPFKGTLVPKAVYRFLMEHGHYVQTQSESTETCEDDRG